MDFLHFPLEVCAARQLRTCRDKVRYGLPRGWWCWWGVSASLRSGLGGRDSLLLQASRAGVPRLLSPPSSHVLLEWAPSPKLCLSREYSRKGPLTHWTRPFYIQAPPPQPRNGPQYTHTHSNVYILHTHMCGTTRGTLFYLLFSLCDFRAKLKCKHWELEARAERHLSRTPLSISNQKTSAFIANRGEKQAR